MTTTAKAKPKTGTRCYVKIIKKAKGEWKWQLFLGNGLAIGEVTRTLRSASEARQAWETFHEQYGNGQLHLTAYPVIIGASPLDVGNRHWTWGIFNYQGTASYVWERNDPVMGEAVRSLQRVKDALEGKPRVFFDV